MPDEPSEDLIRYDILAQDAMRGVVKKIITETAKAGLPGDHHFFVSFLTGYPGVRLSSRMRERYPDEMTIVIQHQYWELKAHENSFEIGLSFDDIPENLLIPFASIKGFFDPSVQFGLQFDIADEPDEDEDNVLAISAVEPDDRQTNAVKPEKKQARTTSPTALPAKKTASKPKKKTRKNTPNSKEKTGGEKEPGSADVVSLDAFRKKP